MDPGLVTKATVFIDKAGKWGEPIQTDVPGLIVYGSQTPTALDSYLYEPIVCLNLQGRKEAFVGDRRVTYGAGTSVLASHDLHVRAQIVEASQDAPYLSLVMSVDLDLIRSLHNEIADYQNVDQEAQSFDVGATDPVLMDAMGRYLSLVGNTSDAHVLGPLIKKEIHYRLLTAPHGAMLRNLLERNSHASRIAEAIHRIRQNYTTALSVPNLASAVGMSESSFHYHFKEITATTPLQYQKGLRLLEARRLLVDLGRSVSEAAYEVGYESATQFSREYSRKFGTPPSQDLA